MTPEDVVRTYLEAKDDNRPWLMPRAFAPDATLTIVAPPGSIPFPPVTQGIDAITDVLVRRFAQTFENVLTFCLAVPPARNAPGFECAWLVGMSEKESRVVRMGLGRYDWSFRASPSCVAQRLAIVIEAMHTLPADTLAPVMNWLHALPYPWCAPSVAADAAPIVEGLAPIVRSIRELAPR